MTMDRHVPSHPRDRGNRLLRRAATPLLHNAATVTRRRIAFRALFVTGLDPDGIAGRLDMAPLAVTGFLMLAVSVPALIVGGLQRLATWRNIRRQVAQLRADGHPDSDTAQYAALNLALMNNQRLSQIEQALSLIAEYQEPANKPHLRVYEGGKGRQDDTGRDMTAGLGR